MEKGFTVCGAKHDDIGCYFLLADSRLRGRLRLSFQLERIDSFTKLTDLYTLPKGSWEPFALIPTS